RIATRHDGGVHRPCGGPGNAIDLDGRFLQEAVQNSPGERTVRPTSLQRKVDEKRTVARSSQKHGNAFPRVLRKCRRGSNQEALTIVPVLACLLTYFIEPIELLGDRAVLYHLFIAPKHVEFRLIAFAPEPDIELMLIQAEIGHCEIR